MRVPVYYSTTQLERRLALLTHVVNNLQVSGANPALLEKYRQQKLYFLSLRPDAAIKGTVDITKSKND
jgi:hypothetical protein